MAAGNGILWHINYKINTQERGLNMKFHVADKTEDQARIAAVALATRLRNMMPTDVSIFFATISKDDHKKDSRFVDGAVGPGLYVSAGAGPPPSIYDFPTTSILVRLEHEDGASVTRKIGPVPDEVISDGTILPTIANVLSLPVAAPAAFAPGDLYAVTFNAFLKEIMFYTSHVVSGHVPGGPYVYFPWTKAYVLRVGQKKGGRVFRS